MSTDDLIDQVKKTVLFLVREKGISQSTIFLKIRDTLKTASENSPLIPVAYNVAHGSFSISEHFRNFLGFKDHERTTIARSILPYGIHISKVYPELYEVIAILNHTNIQTLMQISNSINAFVDMIKRIENNKKDLERHIESVVQTKVFSTSGKKPDITCLTSAHCHWWVYDINQLIKFNSEIDITQLINEYHNKIKDTESTPIWSELSYDIKIAISSFKKKYNVFKSSHTAFIDLYDLKMYDKAWESQSFFDTFIISLIFYCKEFNTNVYEYFLQFIKHDDIDIYQTLGLLAASGDYCQMAITYVPHLVDWKINEYDGTEEIVIL